MSDLCKNFADEFQRAVRWSNREERVIADYAKSLCSSLNEEMDGAVHFEINTAYFKDGEFQLDCTKSDTGTHATVRAKFGANNLITISNKQGAWQGVADRNAASQVHSIIASALARQFANEERHYYEGAIFREELGQ